ncbi:hypothetical protein D6817_03175, partial [Candidatus Pacearchaeota archaeon]
VGVEGGGMEEYSAIQVLEAFNFGFPLKRALLLKDEEFAFRTIPIKSHTRRGLEVVKGRLIGKRGKTKRVLSEISGCAIIIRDTEVGILGNVSQLEALETAIINLIKGTKQSNVYHYLERMNRIKKEEDNLPIK